MRMNVISPFVMVIFGATGDLTSSKLMPALYHLLEQGILPERFFIVGFARRKLTDLDFREMMKEAVAKTPSVKNIDLNIWDKLSKNLYYQQGFFEDRSPYDALIPLLATFDKEIGACITRFFYMATPPSNYSTILNFLDETKLSEGCGQGSSKWTRVLIEKPFGKDLDQAKQLEEQLAKTFDEKQIYRIDHYLAKETIQNILAFRFANQVESLWNKDYIDYVQITLAESGGIGKRGKFYEGVGALKDTGQNHLMAMLAYTTMEEPENMTANEVRKKRIEVLQQIKRTEENRVATDVVRGQYGALKMGERTVLGYRQERDVAANSLTETFVAFKLFIDNSRWQGVPFYLRTGKRLSRSVTRIDIQFKNRESKLFKQFQMENHQSANLITIRVAPQEGITMKLFAKTPGFAYEIRNVDMDFSYRSTFNREIVDSYEKILIDSMTGDQTLFATASGFEATWQFISSITRVWEKQPPANFPNYEAGSWGPKEAEELIERDGRKWMA
ncbi:glucose-6-phosphate dehydrogenase [Candidatus Gottesmanbacteria bacterium RBG_16_37_8]|uniref:Glucose-6-phosphate 1-dehydrogenase n=1 Tax=Candidatus Gottesmanbacteria bacterium RBG_16_37_8 TaxID=1798371 RepID=A0A1F5YPU6_9BACT|nr:MAG: glucose-6-phosphate dehydrogenase [Candidatus Gottesmanbacteria bacterium RBG_16_37_8]